MKFVGFSGHDKDIAIDVVAYTSCAIRIERHSTLDRTWKGTDHAAYLRPDVLRKLKHHLYAAYEALKFKKIDFSEAEKKQAKKLRWDRSKIKNSNNNLSKK